MQNDELASAFMEGLFLQDEEQMIVRRLLANTDELELIDQLLNSEPEEPTDD